jgi:predicted DCC family thiol-disulfide oxidoreductase YuxK
VPTHRSAHPTALILPQWRCWPRAKRCAVHCPERIAPSIGCWPIIIIGCWPMIIMLADDHYRLLADNHYRLLADDRHFPTVRSARGFKYA